MKKLVSVILSLIMLVSAFAVSAMPALAADPVKSPTATTVHNKKPTLEVNGSVSTEIKYTADENDPYVITFEYTGDGTLVGWEENLENLGLVEGEDYTITYNEDGTLTISFVSDDAQYCWDNGKVIINAIVEFDEDETTGNGGNGGNKSPNTGATASSIAATVAVAGAGLAVLAVTKKRDAE